MVELAGAESVAVFIDVGVAVFFWFWCYSPHTSKELVVSHMQPLGVGEEIFLE